MNFGSSIEGIPSLGGPPDRISLKSTDELLKSVIGHSALFSSAYTAAP